MHLWVTYALGLLLVGVSLGVFYSAPNAADTAGENPEMRAAFRYFERNPEVKVNPRMARLIGHDYMAEVRERHEKRRAEGGVAILSQRMREKTQKRFDEAQRKAFASLQDLPSWRYGIVDGSSPLQNTITHLVVNDTAVQIGVSLVAIGIAAMMLEAAWGPLLFGALCLLLPFVTRVTYTSLYGDYGVPWIGASGLAAGLLGAYLVRSFAGLTIPAWLVVPVWVVAEYVFARDLPIDSFDPAPVVVHGVSFAFGAAAAGVIWMLRIEGSYAARKADTKDLLSNPVLEQALAERDAGNEDAAFDLLFDEVKRSPGNYDVAVALWQVASGGPRASAAAHAIVAAVRDALRSGRMEEACSLWTSMAVEVEPRAEATVLVRLGEALLSQEEHEGALKAFGLAVGGPKPLSSVLALRVVRGTRDLDSALAAKAASVALVDDQLALADRNAMQEVIDSVQARGGAPEPAALEAPQVAAVVEDAPAEHAPATPPADPDPYQDPHAIAADAFEELPEGESLAGEDPDQWNQPNLVEDLSAELEDEGVSEQDAGGFDWSGLQDEGEQTEPQQTGVDTRVELGESDSHPAGEDGSDISDTTDELEPDSLEDLAVGLEDGLPDAELGTTPRQLRARAAVPVSLQDDAIGIEVDGGAKTQLPLARIEAVAAGAVRGLADKPVLVVDLVLNWLDVPDEPLKVVRLRSDGFDPRTLVPEADSALDAVRMMLDRLVSRSGATPLPDRSSALGNPFATFEDLAAYGREVLMVE